MGANENRVLIKSDKNVLCLHFRDEVGFLMIQLPLNNIHTPHLYSYKEPQQTYYFTKKVL